jgi:hypothetical protein
MKDRTTILVILVLVLVGVAVAEGVALWTQARIAGVRAEVEEFNSYRDSVNAVVALRDSLVRESEVVVEAAERVADSLRAELAKTDSILREQRLSVRRLATFEDINADFESEFAILAARSFRMKYAEEPGPDSLDYIVMPTASLNTFVAERRELTRLRNDAVIADSLDATNVVVIETQDTIIGLLRANQSTLQQAFDTTSVLYIDRSEELIDELRKPSFGFGLGTGIAGGILIGLLAGIAAAN